MTPFKPTTLAKRVQEDDHLVASLFLASKDHFTYQFETALPERYDHREFPLTEDELKGYLIELQQVMHAHPGMTFTNVSLSSRSDEDRENEIILPSFSLSREDGEIVKEWTEFHHQVKLWSLEITVSFRQSEDDGSHEAFLKTLFDVFGMNLPERMREEVVALSEEFDRTPAEQRVFRHVPLQSVRL